MAGSLILIANKRKYYWLLGLLLGANIQFEAGGGTFILIATLLFLIFINPFKTKLKDYIMLVTSFIITLVPQLIFEIRHGFLMTKRAFEYLGTNKTSSKVNPKERFLFGIFLDIIIEMTSLV
jgi:hypothetical protein